MTTRYAEQQLRSSVPQSSQQTTLRGHCGHHELQTSRLFVLAAREHGSTGLSLSQSLVRIFVRIESGHVGELVAGREMIR